jgi:cell division protein FtsB
MKIVNVGVLAASLSIAAFAEDKPLDKANAKLREGQKAVKSGAKQLESDTNKALEKARKRNRKTLKKLDQGLNDAAKSFR